MLIRDLKKCEEFTAGDETLLRELIHPDKQKAEVRYSLAHAVVKPGKTSRLHSLKTSELYYIMEGTGTMFIDKESAPVGPGQAVYIPPHARQCIRNTGTTDLKFICIVDPAWRKEDEEVF